MTSFRIEVPGRRELVGEDGETWGGEGNAPWWATWLWDMFLGVVLAEIEEAVSGVGAASALESFWTRLVLVSMDAEVVIFAEGGTALFALIGARGSVLGVAEHVTSQVTALGGSEIALGAGVGFLSCVGSLVDSDFGGISKAFRAFRAAAIPLPNAIRHACLAGSVDEMGVEVVPVDEVVAEEAIAGKARGAAPTGEKAGYGAELDVVGALVATSEGDTAKGAGVRWC